MDCRIHSTLVMNSMLDGKSYGKAVLGEKVVVAITAAITSNERAVGGVC